MPYHIFAPIPPAENPRPSPLAFSPPASYILPRMTPFLQLLANDFAKHAGKATAAFDAGDYNGALYHVDMANVAHKHWERFCPLNQKIEDERAKPSNGVVV